MHYSEIVEKLFESNQKGGIKLGLNNMTRLLQALGNPEKRFASVHVAGTNGKGSVVTKIAEAYRLAGKKVGLYTSPHISTFRERIKINNEMISETAVEQLYAEIEKSVLSLDLHPTFFELTTALAFLHFAHEKIDIAVLETGLGGRLDATNVVTPLLAVITSIGLDHTEILGSTIEQIALEKAGIMKPHVPVLIGPNVPSAIFRTQAEKLHCKLTIVDGVFDSYDSENSGIAKKALELLHLPEQFISPALKARPPCRMEKIAGAPVILDVGHNPAGLEALFRSLHKEYPGQRFQIIAGLSKSKDLKGCLRLLNEEAGHLYLVQAESERAAEVSALERFLRQMNVEQSRFSASFTVANALKKALLKPPVLIVGTFFIMDGARRALGLCHPQDRCELNEHYKSN